MRSAAGYLTIALVGASLLILLVADSRLLQIVAIIFLLVFTIQFFLDLIQSLTCPACGGHRFRRHLTLPFGIRYVSCRSCGARLKRGVLGYWEDASEARDDRYFRKEQADPWAGQTRIADPSTKSTHGELLRNKLRRRASSTTDEPVED